MQILPLKKNARSYSCNSYLILGTWNRIEDVNTVIDPGIDGYIIDEISRLSTGFGKVPVEQVVLTHNHFDHGAGVPALKNRYGCRVLAFQEGPDVDATVKDGDVIRAGEGVLEVLHTPGHSSDSISLYAPAERALFCGDTQLRVHGPGGSYEPDYMAALERLAALDVEVIYHGHDPPLLEGGRELILKTLQKVRHGVRH